MATQAFYQDTIDSSVYGELINYVNSIEQFNKVKQNYMGSVYQSVLAKRLTPGNPIEKQITDLFLEQNRKNFDYDLFGTFEVQVMKYLPGDGYNWHCDFGVSENQEGDRKLSMIIQLSNPWDYNGGDIEVVDWYNRTHNMNKDCGSIMVFDSRTPHRVKSVTLGERYSITAWAHGPRLR